jgi:nitrate reductase gamma subunit
MTELLDFARGPALQWALAIFAFGTVWRLGSLLLLPWTKDPSRPREGAPSALAGAGHGILVRFWPHRPFSKRALFHTVNGYVFHIGLAVVVLLFQPHILFFEDLVGFGWPGLPNNVIYAVGVITVVSLIAALVRRITNPVQRLISKADDYISWALTVAPVITGLMATAHIGGRYETLLAVHILTVAAFLIWFPFGKLMHTFLFVLSRGVTGARLQHRGAKV